MLQWLANDYKRLQALAKLLIRMVRQFTITMHFYTDTENKERIKREKGHYRDSYLHCLDIVGLIESLQVQILLPKALVSSW